MKLSKLSFIIIGAIQCWIALSSSNIALALDANTSLPECTDTWKDTDPQFNYKEAYSDYYARTKRSECRKDWTVLVFMEADNDLFPYASWNLWEMEAGTTDEVDRTASTSKLDLIVEAEGPQALPSGKTSNSLRRLHMFSQRDTGPTSPWRFSTKKSVSEFGQMTLDNVKSPIIENLGANAPDGEGDRLREFLLWGQKTYPAHHYLVIIWGHGEGWGAISAKSKSNILTSGGLAYRDSTGAWLSVVDLDKALNEFKAVNKAPIDVFATDACLMQMLEVAEEISGDANYVIGTTHVQANLGLPYRNIFIHMNTGLFWGYSELYADTDTATNEPLLTAMMLPRLMLFSVSKRITYEASGKKRVITGYHYLDDATFKSVTSSSIDAHTLSNYFIPSLKDLEVHIERYLNEYPATDPHAIWRFEHLKSTLANVPLIEGGAQDFGAFLGMFYSLLAEEKQKEKSMSVQAQVLVQCLTKTKSDLDHTVTSFIYGDGYGFDPKASENESRRAVSLWLPIDADQYLQRRDEFIVSKFYRLSHWNNWLDILYGITPPAAN